MTRSYEGYPDFPAFIIGITRRIWEDRGVASLHKLYAPEIIVRSPDSVVVGNQAVIQSTLATLAEFPDRVLLGEDVIWYGEPEVGLLSSHRILSEATHLADGDYGSASGKRLRYRIIADCHALNGRIDDEWLIRDQGAIVHQLGHSPESFVRRLAETEGAAKARPTRCMPIWTASWPAIWRSSRRNTTGRWSWPIRGEACSTRMRRPTGSGLGFGRASPERRSRSTIASAARTRSCRRELRFDGAWMDDTTVPGHSDGRRARRFM